MRLSSKWGKWSETACREAIIMSEIINKIPTLPGPHHPGEGVSKFSETGSAQKQGLRQPPWFLPLPNQPPNHTPCPYSPSSTQSPGHPVPFQSSSAPVPSLIPQPPHLSPLLTSQPSVLVLLLLCCSPPFIMLFVPCSSYGFSDMIVVICFWLVSINISWSIAFILPTTGTRAALRLRTRREVRI